MRIFEGVLRQPFSLVEVVIETAGYGLQVEGEFSDGLILKWLEFQFFIPRIHIEKELLDSLWKLLQYGTIDLVGFINL